MTVWEMVVKKMWTIMASRICSFGIANSIPNLEESICSKCALTRCTLSSARRLTEDMLVSTSKLSVQDCRMQSDFVQLTYSNHLKRVYVNKTTKISFPFILFTRGFSHETPSQSHHSTTDHSVTIAKFDPRNL